MWRGNIVRFQHRFQAVNAGQKPCRYCLPRDWKSVGASILGAETVCPTEAKKPLAKTPTQTDAPFVQDKAADETQKPANITEVEAHIVSNSSVLEETDQLPKASSPGTTEEVTPADIDGVSSD